MADAADAGHEDHAHRAQDRHVLRVVAGEKERADPARGPASYHLVERDFGRFARAIRIHAAVDAGQSRARLKDGELRVLLPKIQERRGRELLMTIETESTPQG